jgi:hypothetical protein
MKKRTPASLLVPLRQMQDAQRPRALWKQGTRPGVGGYFLNRRPSASEMKVPPAWQASQSN